MEINMKLKKSDLKNIGHTAHQDNGTTTFYCHFRTVNLEVMFLRSILEHHGYKITAEDDATCHPSSDSPDSTVFFTNLPWDEYMKLSCDS